MAKLDLDDQALPGTRPPPVRNVGSLTGMRFLMSVTVFLSHTAILLPVPYINGFFDLGGAGGTFFFVLSGFALTWSLSSTDTPLWFLGRRMSRVWPTLVIAVALPLGFALSAQGADVLHMLGAAAASIFFVQAWIPPVVLQAPNPVTWMMSCVVFFYLIFPWLGRFALRRTAVQLAAIALGALVYGWAIRVGLWILYPPAEPLLLEDSALLTFGVYSPLGRIHEFLFGVLIAAAMRRGWRPPFSVGAVITVLVAVLGVMWLMRDTSWRSAVPHDPLDLVTAPLFACLCAAYADREVRGGRSLLAKPGMLFAGKLSMAFYLFHFTVVLTVASMVFPDKSMIDFFLRPVEPSAMNLLWTLVALAVSFVLSWLVFRYYEDPIERRLHTYLEKRTRARRGAAR